jgi:hypothetical protein
MPWCALDSKWTGMGMRRWFFFLGSVLAFASCGRVLQPEAPPSWRESFESEGLPEGWKSGGEVGIEKGDSFDGSRCLKLLRTADQAHLPVHATGPVFPAVTGQWEVSVVGKADIYSPDNSFNGRVWIESLDGGGKMTGRFTVGDFGRQKDWTAQSRVVEFSEGTMSARFRVEMNKTHGIFKVDVLKAVFRAAGRSETETVDRILFSTAQMGNLLYPEDSRVIRISVETFRALPEKFRTLSLEVTDYWGAEQGPVLQAPLKRISDISYEAEIDLSKTALEEGRYYEIHARVSQPGSRPASNYSSLAILPEASNRRYKPEEVPFTSRNWDNRIEEFYPLTDRLGLRVCGIRGTWSSEPPYEAQAQRIDLVEKFGMGALTTTPIHAIEHQRAGWEKYNEEALRDGVRNMIAKIGPVRPLVINLGNEPPGNDPEVIRRSVAAYKLVYQEIKKRDPSIFVLGSSSGPIEEFFRQGFGEWCDAYDFHTYNDPDSVRSSLRKYREFFKKYGQAKPVWSTEIGLNSQGLERRAVSVDMIKKFTAFFAEGGANFSWFGLLYPDPDLKLHGGSEDAHNVFDCRYRRYAPKLDALTYYYMVNGIGIKKFIEEKTYDTGVYAALFRDRDRNCLQVLWKEDGDADVFVPLPGTGKVRVVRIDGRSRELEAGEKGISLTVSPDPVLLEYVNPSARLASGLPAPAASISGADRSLVLGSTALLSLKVNEKGMSAEVQAPPLWKTEKQSSGNHLLKLPANSRIREAVLAVAVKDVRGNATGDLMRRLPVSGKLSMRLLPEPAVDGREPGVRLILSNNSDLPVKASWDVSLTGEMALKSGSFGLPESPAQALAGKTSGRVELPAGGAESLVMAMPGADRNKLYRVKAVAAESAENVLELERFIGGFVGVRKADRAPVLDGVLDEEVWEKAQVIRMEKANHFNLLKRKEVPAAGSWQGTEDLSATTRFLWDDKYLYVGVGVVDDIAGSLKADGALWAQDGLQFLIDPAREFSRKPGKYDYAVAVGSKGIQAWAHLTADPLKAPVNEVKDFLLSHRRLSKENGSISYELAIPWSRVSPFKPVPGANLGLALILNEDDGKGRDSFMAWFGNAHTKQVDTAGDLILLDATR